MFASLQRGPPTTDETVMHRHPAARRYDRGFTLVELLIVIVILGVLATVTVFAVRGIIGDGDESATAADERTLVSAQEAHMAQQGDYATEAELVAAGLLRSESGLHDVDIAVDSLSYQIVAEGAGGGGGGGGPAPIGTPIAWGGVPAATYGAGAVDFVVIGGAQALAQWNALVTASAPVAANRRMVFIDIADITTPAIAEAVHDASIPFGRVWSLADDVANFSGGVSMSLYMELSNGPAPQTYAKINDGSAWDVAWAFTA